MANQKKKGKQKSIKLKRNKNEHKETNKPVELSADKPTEYFGTDFFHFWNGDTYVGNFKATINKQLTKEGEGKYFTNDGSSYSGAWVNDELLCAKKIKFTDGTVYEGNLLNGQFSGQGVYIIPEIGSFYCDFVDGKPVGVVMLKDVDNNKWQGTADGSAAIMYPKNHFFYSEEETEENGKIEEQLDVHELLLQEIEVKTEGQDAELAENKEEIEGKQQKEINYSDA